MPPQLRDNSEFQYHRLRLQFGETFITCAPAVFSANPAYGKAIIGFKLDSPHRLAIAAAAQREPEDVKPETEVLATREMAQIYAETVVMGWEGPGSEDPAAWLVEHPDDFEALVIYCEDLEIFRRGASDGNA